MDQSGDSVVDLSPYTPEEACYWLLNELKVGEHVNKPYAIPYMNYVLTWPNAIPLTAIVTAQSPYPNNIFSSVSAAMSYSTDLCMEVMKKPMPPTVEVLANDLYINAGMDRSTSVSILKDGWALVSNGILLVNESVFQNHNTPQSFKESADQCNVIIRLLRETEKYGKRTIDVFALGESGERMGSNLCSWYKSDIVRLSKRKATHPAGIARRFEDLQDSKCTLGVPALSRALAKHFSNYVASIHTMAKPSKLELDLKRQANAIVAIGVQFESLKESTSTYTALQKELEMATNIDDEKYKDMIRRVTAAGDQLVFRLNIASAAAQNIASNAGGISNYVGKAGPTLATVHPSNRSISGHVGHESEPASPVLMKPVKLQLGPSRKGPASSVPSEFTGVSSPGSVKSIGSTTPSRTIKLNLGKSPRSTISTSQQSMPPSVLSETSTISPEEERQPTTSSLGARFRKMNITQESKPSDNSGKKENTKEAVEVVEHTLTRDCRNQLSAVEAVVLAAKPDARDNEDFADMLENIQHDISVGTAYNRPVYELVDAIKQDLKNIKNFDLTNYMFEDNKLSATYNKCKELFEF